MTQAFAPRDYIAGAVEDVAAQGECLPLATEAAPETVVKRLPWLAAILAVFLHTMLLLLGFWLGGKTGEPQAESLPRFISVSLDNWPSGGADESHEVVPVKKSALPPGNAMEQKRVSAPATAEKEISKENLSSDSVGIGREQKRMTPPASGGNGLSSQAALRQGGGTTEGTQQGAFPEVLARPLYEKNPPPRYPRLAIRLGKQGVVLLDVCVSASGTVEDAKVAAGSGYEILDESALEAVRGWRFAPGQRNGQPAGMWVRVPVRFNLRDGN